MHLFVCLRVCLSASLRVCLLSFVFSLFRCLFLVCFSLFVCLLVCLFVCLNVCLFACLLLFAGLRGVCCGRVFSWRSYSDTAKLLRIARAVILLALEELLGGVATCHGQGNCFGGARKSPETTKQPHKRNSRWAVVVSVRKKKESKQERKKES